MKKDFYFMVFLQLNKLYRSPINDVINTFLLLILSFLLKEMIWKLPNI